MIFIEKIKLKIGKKLLPRRAKSISRLTSFHNFETAKTISILFDAQNEQNFQIIKKYIDELIVSGKKINALGLTKNIEATGSFLYKKGVDFFHEGKLSWLGVPESQSIIDFLDLKTDLFFDLTLNTSYYIEYITTLTNASLKIADAKKTGYTDLTIELGQNRNLTYFIEQINHYLGVLKKA